MQWRSYAPKHGIRPLNTMTVGDVDQTLCKQKETVLLYGTNGEKNTLNQRLDLPFTANKVRSFQNCHLCVYFNLIWVNSCGAC